MAPRQARYRAHFGRALARDKATRRQAEAELLAAVSLDALDASFRVMLAELYREVGLRRNAEAQLERALVLEPSNAQAQALLKELRRDDG
jgi:predicted Zn-dependent protease